MGGSTFSGLTVSSAESEAWQVGDMDWGGGRGEA